MAYRRLIWGLLLEVFAGVGRLDLSQHWSAVASLVIALAGLGVAFSAAAGGA